MKLEYFSKLALLLLLMTLPIVAAESVSKTDTPKNSTLEGVSWSLDSYLGRENNTESVLTYTQITALFQSGHVSGTGGCNSYGGSYVAMGDSITFSGITSTLMFCAENISDQESVYFMNLQDAARYEIAGNLLKMLDANGTVILTYSVAQPLPLNNTAWEMLTYNNGKGGLVSSLLDTRVTALFRIDGNLTGSAGCNNYMSSYRVNDTYIEIGPIGATRMYCAMPDGIMEQESGYLKALESAVYYELNERKLTLLNANNTTAVTYQRYLE
jgi:heat shock protein HslJ